MKKTIAILAFSALIFSSCKKETVEELPPATQTGANTFGAKVDGSFWIPQEFGSISGNILEARLNGLGGFFINASNLSQSPTETEFEIYIDSLAGPGTYLLNKNTDKYPYQTASYGFYIKRKFMPLGEWMTNTTHTGKVVITKFDQASKIVSGTFEFQAGSTDNSANPITVTEGRFDVIYQ